MKNTIRFKENEITFLKANMSEMEYDLIMMLEISVSNGIFVEGNKPIHIDGKSICYPKKEELIGKTDKFYINYDPFNNRKIAYYLFNKYAAIRQMEDPTLEIMSFFIAKDIVDTDGKIYAMCRTNKGSYTSDKFTNESLCWIDLIYKMECGSVPELLNRIDELINYERLLQQNEREGEKKNGRTK